MNSIQNWKLTLRLLEEDFLARMNAKRFSWFILFFVEEDDINLRYKRKIQYQQEREDMNE